MPRLPLLFTRGKNVNEIVLIEAMMDTLSYDAISGLFTWRVNRAAHVRIGSKAGTLCQGRRYIKFLGKGYLAHRIAHAFMTGSFPDKEIDHIDGNADNNAWDNLRACNRHQNMQNTKRKKSSVSGLVGVSPHHGIWQSNISINHKQIYLGCFPTKDEAHEAYLDAKRKYHTFNPEVTHDE